MKQKQLTIGIVGGNGKMGHLFKNFFESSNFKVLVFGRDNFLSLKNLAKDCNILMVSVPISKTVETINKVIPLIREDSLLCDISSLKVQSMEAMKKSKSATLGMHPLFGPSISISKGQKIVFCKQKDNLYVELLKNIFKKKGISVIESSPEEHDNQMGYIQALTHAVNLLFAKKILEDGKIPSNLQTPTFILQSLLMGRILQQDLNLTAEMMVLNPFFPKIFDGFINNAKNLYSDIIKMKTEKIIDDYSKDKKIIKNFSNFSSFKTNKILTQISEAPSIFPKKISVKKILGVKNIAYLGPEGTYSYIAASTVFPNINKVSCNTLFEIFYKVANGEVEMGIVPAENSVEGVVKNTLDYLADFSLNIIGSFETPIHHQLLSVENKINDIKFLVSHPQALSQCQEWIRENLPQVKIITSDSTVSDIEHKKGYGYVSSRQASDKYKIKILAKNIEDNKENSTRFYVISKNLFEINKLNKSKTLLFLTIYNRVGILRDILDIFADHGLNLTKLESRPSKEKKWDYHFFIEVDKKYKDPMLECALKELDVYCPAIKILGQT